jgi:prephenate dehydratase
VGHAEDTGVAAALAGLRERAALFRIVGSYPRAIL